ncbi:trace amine-associated receptor 13c-like [Solea senegalensis]|uniref:Trace amine-associated receptor 13c-like n=1 Tax=Solea senegalensis TaxID=28829 RepID=A0AAV6RFC1_SOLSE|nr:trace amine-associated receptor 8a-like [Solea senegalensis]KAG7503190.1 trace amine-associated receptor 13c-like [Solea senegalensis]
MQSLNEADLCFPQFLNASCRKTPLPPAVSMITYIMLTFIGLLTVILNLLVIVSISHFRKLHTPTNILLLSLGISDLLVGFLIFLQTSAIDGCWFLGDFMCILYYVLQYVITASSIGTMVLISVDRYVAICDPMHYRTKVSEKRVKMCVCACWGCATLCHCVLLRHNLKQPGSLNSCIGECVILINNISAVIDMTVSFIGPVIVVVILYLRVFVAVIIQVRAMRVRTAAGPQQSSVKVKKSEMKAARTLGIVIVVFLLCVCPFFSGTVTGMDTLLSASSDAFIILLFYFNSCLNPLIYAFFYPWFRKSIKLIFTLQILKPGSSDFKLM